MARRLEALPDLAEAFGDGRVSYSKRGVRRARLAGEARTDPELAAWTLRTRTRYDDNGNFTLTISGPAQYLPEIQAGIAAKKAELQRERDAQTSAVPTPAEPVAVEAMPAEAEVPICVPATTPAAELVDLDEQVPVWPVGTTRRQLSAAMDSYLVPQQCASDRGEAGPPGRRSRPPTAADHPDRPDLRVGPAGRR